MKWGPLNEVLADPIADPLNDYIFIFLLPFVSSKKKPTLFSFVCGLFLHHDKIPTWE